MPILLQLLIRNSEYGLEYSITKDDDFSLTRTQIREIYTDNIYLW